MSHYYQPSGKFSPLSFVYFIIAALVLMPILAGIYAYAIWYMPLVYINFLITIAFGFAVALTVNLLVVQFGKVRNYVLALVFSLLAFCVAYYVHWAVWVDLAINVSETYGNKRIGVAVSTTSWDEVLYLLLHPSDLFGLIGEINEEGVWSLKGKTVNGGFLTFVWVIEALIILVISFLAGANRAKEPFSEEKNEWFKEEELPAFSYIENTTDFKQNAEQNLWTDFEALQVLGEKAKQEIHSVFTLYSSGREYYLSVENKLAKMKKDKVEFDDDLFIKYLRINKEAYDMIKTKQ